MIKKFLLHYKKKAGVFTVTDLLGEFLTNKKKWRLLKKKLELLKTYHN